ncbi:MAG: hypothetical protein PWP04_1732 [Candidatus Atribacteria bacterium]|nr:hypothetical protein [Candidatus Atribacteria bacterium]
MTDTILIIVGMTLVTFIPRFLPFLAFSRLRFPRPVKKLLRYIPPAALGALILPGVWTAIPNYPLVAIVGAAAAVICSWFKGEIILTVFLSVTVAFLGLYFLGY